MNWNPSAALSTLCIGESSVIRSSADLSWIGFLLERQLAGANMRINDHGNQNMLALVCSQVMRGERRTNQEQLLYEKWVDSLPEAKATAKCVQTLVVLHKQRRQAVIPRGPVSEMILVSPAEPIYRSFDE